MRGRVSAVNAVFISSSNQMGDFESGLTASWFGPVWSVVGGGIGTILVVMVVMLVWPQVLRLGPLSQVRDGRGNEGDRARKERPTQRREFPAVNDLSKRRDVFRRRTAATADHAHAGVEQFRQPGRHHFRRLRINPAVAVAHRRAGVGPGEQRQVGDAAIAADDFDDLVHADVAAAVDAEGGGTVLPHSANHSGVWPLEVTSSPSGLRR